MTNRLAFFSVLAFAACSSSSTTQPGSSPTPVASGPLVSGTFRSCAQVPRSMHCANLAVKIVGGIGIGKFAKASPVLVGVAAPVGAVSFVITGLSSTSVTIETRRTSDDTLAPENLTINVPVVAR